MLNAIDQYNHLKDSQSLVFAYKGSIDESLVSSVLNIIENKLGMVEYNSKLKKKIFNIIVELIQNVFHNYEENSKYFPEELKEIALLVEKKTEFYNIYCGNFIRSSEVDSLEKTISEVNKMTSESLRQQYRDRLDKGVISDNGRAGLGIMDIVRKSNNAIAYNFDKVDENLSLFSLKVEVKINS